MSYSLLINKNWTEYFRPSKIDDILSHESILDTLKKCISNKYLPHLLFYGSPGTGKTSTILSCAKMLYGDMYDIMVLEINASEERGIEMVRSKIKSFATTKIRFDNYIPFKLIILDEADSLTADAQGMLRLVIEKYTVNVRFCLICNYIKNINSAILSRCTLFKFKYIKPIYIKKKIDEIIEKLKNQKIFIDIDESGYDFLIKIVNGDMRKLLNLFQLITMYKTGETNSFKINETIICDCIGYPSSQIISEINNILVGSKKICEKYNIINNIIITNSYNLQDIINELTEILINILLKDISKLSMIANIIDQFSKTELNLSVGATTGIQLTSIISIFIINKILN